jgi:DnaJ-class molecular chaperone
MMTRFTAVSLLGLADAAPLTAAAIDTAYRQALRACHPDTTEHQAAPRATMAQLQEARKTLQDVITGQNNACTLCHGGGKVRMRLGTVPCAPCKGTGERQP